MKLVGVHHVSLNVDDVDSALAFYVGTLGLVVRSDRPDLGFAGAWLDAGDQQVHLIDAPIPTHQGQHFALRVDDLEATINELRDDGVDVSDAIRIGTGRQAFLHDPAGNLVELHQVATSSDTSR
jgi:catechol 2,3-dioxygenase-like lactoylglutathione lyase family enzyme